MSKVRHFKTNTLLKNLIGKDLINDDNIGIIELVKNSYDASSNKVRIEFRDTSNKSDSKLIIADSGTGMNESDINDKWLNVAYSEKKQSEQLAGAFLAGNKGVGRFSCDRLGEELDIYTKTNNGKILHLFIDWKKFEIEGEKDLTIQEIDVFLDTVTNEQVLNESGISLEESGTILVISKLRSNWNNEERLLELKKHLQKFINPNQLFSRDEFVIELIAKDFRKRDQSHNSENKINGKVSNLIFENLKFKATYIEAKTIENGSKIKTSLYHDGQLVYWIEEENTFSSFIKHASTTIYFLNAYKKSYFKRQTGIRSIDFGSIFLFLNGFRVAPYGDRGNDWLKLDIRQGQGKSRFFGSRDIVGRIELVDTLGLFEPVSSREGLKENHAFGKLREEFFYGVLRRLEKFVVEGLSWDSVPDSARKEIKDSLDWKKTKETYVESDEKKKKRFSLGILSLMGIARKKLNQFWINTDFLTELAEEKTEELKKVLDDIGKYDGDLIDENLRVKLSKVTQIIKDKEERLKQAQSEVVELQDEVAEQEEVIEQLQQDVEEQKETITVLEQQKENVEAQALFLKSLTSQDAKSLLNYHHQICNDAATIDNYIGRAVRSLKKDGNVKQTLKFLEKISKANKKIVATAQYATRANFKAGTKKEMTDIPSYFVQYLENVANEFSASSLNLNIVNENNGLFEMPLKRIELSILIDNLISNSNKANATKIDIHMFRTSENKLEVLFSDDGHGVSSEVDVNSIFDFGVTSTNGSGLGLYHAKEFMDSIGSEISLQPNPSRGVVIKMEFIK